MKIEYLTIETVEYLHQLVLDKDGGLPGIHRSKLEAKLALPMAGFGDYEHYPTVVEKAAVYLYELATGHCFMDGNKRTAYTSTYVFLDLNGYHLVATDDEIVTFVLKIANNETRPPFEKVVRWIEAHVIEHSTNLEE